MSEMQSSGVEVISTPSLGRILFCLFLALVRVGDPWYSLAGGCIIPASSSVVTEGPSSGSLSSHGVLSPYKDTYWIGSGSTLKTSS